jgi:starch phosphorylase
VFSPQFSLGKRIRAVLVNLCLEDAYREALADIGIKIEEIYDFEVEEASTKKGQWATSLIESLATLELPSWGYGIRLNYSHYTAEQKEGETSTQRTRFGVNAGNPWEIKRADITQPIRFGGKLKKTKYLSNGIELEQTEWIQGVKIHALAYDTAVPGYNTFTTNAIRQWSAVYNQDDFA